MEIEMEMEIDVEALQLLPADDEVALFPCGPTSCTESNCTRTC
ncbi:ALQxL family class IV lanthipeptide [Micromonospora eburnea]|uniref:Uncharacterized protein n=1 Tax=Micromonospora eburnea TaxID=227316 RepID=A0A1C6UWU7_9ACTN|nr:ALQxL family class IV lanthipeptide [Micromonospora eburnea]SCL58451.1 hypothetical protein GA0070604_3835 [Micromonospora eburnea]